MKIKCPKCKFELLVNSGAELAKIKWSKTNKKQRLEHGKMMVTAREKQKKCKHEWEQGQTLKGFYEVCTQCKKKIIK